jgi:hypothetical protein
MKTPYQVLETLPCHNITDGGAIKERAFPLLVGLHIGLSFHPHIHVDC